MTDGRAGRRALFVLTGLNALNYAVASGCCGVGALGGGMPENGLYVIYAQLRTTWFEARCCIQLTYGRVGGGILAAILSLVLPRQTARPNSPEHG